MKTIKLLGASFLLTACGVFTAANADPSQLVVHNEIGNPSYIESHGFTSPTASPYQTESYPWSNVEKFCMKSSKCHANVYVLNQDERVVKAGDVFFEDLEAGLMTAHGKNGYRLFVNDNAEVTLQKV